MKTHFIAITVAAGALLAATSTGWARPPRTHSLSGVVEAIDCPSQTVRVSYRRELGQSVLREVSTKGGSSPCGAACK